MVWFKVDDGAAFHHKVIAAGNSAMGLWVRAGSWSAQQLTDGYVPEHMVTVLGTVVQARRLVRAGLWTEAEGGYWFHDWTENDRNPTRDETLLRRKRDSERQSRRRKNNPPNPEDSQDTDDSPPVTPPVSPPVSHGGCPAPPARPVHVSPNGDTSGGARTQATRLPDEFTVTDEMRSWAEIKTPDVPVDYETEKFADYWRAQSGQRGTKRDWVGTWRNWLRKAQEDAGRRRPGQDDRSGPRSTRDQKFADAQRLKQQPGDDGWNLRVIS